MKQHYTKSTQTSGENRQHHMTGDVQSDQMTLLDHKERAYSAFQTSRQSTCKKIKFQKAMNVIDMILGKMDLFLIRRHAYKCNNFSDVDFEVFSKPVYVPLWYSQFQ